MFVSESTHPPGHNSRVKRTSTEKRFQSLFQNPFIRTCRCALEPSLKLQNGYGMPYRRSAHVDFDLRCWAYWISPPIALNAARLSAAASNRDSARRQLCGARNTKGGCYAAWAMAVQTCSVTVIDSRGLRADDAQTRRRRRCETKGRKERRLDGVAD